MKERITIYTLLISVILILLIGCSDSGTNTPHNSNVAPLGGTTWKFIAFVNGETGEKDNPFYKIEDFNNIPEEYFNKEKYYFTLAFFKNTYKVLDLDNHKYPLNLVAYSSCYGRSEGEYNLIPNTNSFEKFYLTKNFGHSSENDVLYMLTLIKTKSFRLNADTLKLYSTPDSTGNYMLFRKIVLEIPDDPYNPSTP